MFEFHGWATIRISDRESEFESIGRGPMVDAIKRVRAALNEAHDEFSAFDLRSAGNGLVVLSVHGLRNHRYKPVIELFRWVATELPDSYGLLYVHDDEDGGRGSDYTNEFRVWRMARGKLEEHADTLLSPYFPTVELPETFDDSA
ncbi:Imm7 family immunity protein [Isosphaeraceae bacterium EP7]